MEVSFTKKGKAAAHEMRHRVATCMKVEELANTFSEVSGRFIGAVTGTGSGALPRGIIFDTVSKQHYRISDDLDREPLFREAWYRSDLPDIIAKFAKSAWHRYLHLMKDDSRSKIRIRI